MLVFLIFSPPLYNFHLFPPTKLVSVYFSLTYTDYPKSVNFALVCQWCGRTVARSLARSVYGHLIIKFSGMGRLPHFLSCGAPLQFPGIPVFVPKGEADDMSISGIMCMEFHSSYTCIQQYFRCLELFLV